MYFLCFCAGRFLTKDQNFFSFIINIKGWVKAESQKHSSGDARTISDTDADNDDWFVFDDDEVSPCDTESVLKLKGGGDWHMSYLNFYRAKK
mmetsp:Transcript_22344/g.25891  ORF Transcript_22344/g.25891 Transcript_22344/m.25891 type:complete len:92 (-) Transcript_22344:212-487(-)